MDVLNEDMAMEILSWLPVKSLLIFRSVSKLWHSLINNSSFIAKHTKNQLMGRETNDANMMIFHVDSRCDKIGLSLLCTDDLIKRDGDDSSMFFPFPTHPVYVRDFADLHPKVRMLGPCDGLMCFIVGGFLPMWGKTVTLWNPATRECKHISPPPPIRFEFPPCSDVGFGFDSTTNDYKVIVVTLCSCHQSYSTRHLSHESQVKIYSLNNNCWRNYDCNSSILTKIIMKGSSWESCSTIYQHEIFCWLAKDQRHDEEIILSFNIRQEVFQTTSLPLPGDGDDKKLLKGGIGHLFSLHDSIALVVSYQHQHKGNTYQIWSISDLQKGRFSWTKMSTVGPLPETTIPLGFFWRRNTKDFLLLLAGKENLFGHDPYGYYKRLFDTRFMLAVYVKSHQGEDMKSYNMMTINYCYKFFVHQVLNYEETLVSVNRS